MQPIVSRFTNFSYEQYSTNILSQFTEMALDDEQTDKPKSTKTRANRVKKQMKRKPRNAISFAQPRRGTTKKN
jgi:hypothetical protein